MRNIKVYIILLLIFICLLPPTSVNAINSTSNVYKEGLYHASDLHVSEGNLYTVQNVSDSSVILQVYNDKEEVEQYLKLPPSSRKFSLIPLKNDYKIVILGRGEVYISEG